MPASGETWPRRVCAQCGKEKALTAYRSERLYGEVATICRLCEDTATDPDAEKRATSRERIEKEAGMSYAEVKRQAIAGSLSSIVPPVELVPPVEPIQPAATAAAPEKPQPVPVTVAYPVVRAVLRYLPAEPHWTSIARDRFFAALQAAVDLEITCTEG